MTNVRFGSITDIEERPSRCLLYPQKRTSLLCCAKRAGVSGFRFHDFRHDFASKLLHETGNLKLVQRAQSCRPENH